MSVKDLPLGARVALVGTNNNQMVTIFGDDWYEQVMTTVDNAFNRAAKLKEDGEKTKVFDFNGTKYYIVEILTLVLMEYSDTPKSEMEKDGISIRNGNFIETWDCIKHFASVTDLKQMQESKIVQQFIKGGYKPEYVGVPETEFAEFKKTYEKPGFFTGLFGSKKGGRKSRKQNKSRKQGKSKKQRKSRK